MFHSTRAPRCVPWRDAAEWVSVRNLLFSPSAAERWRGLQHVAAWRARGANRCPLSVDSTAHLTELQLKDAAQQLSSANLLLSRSSAELRLGYGLALLRFVNGIVDPGQQGAYAASVAAIAERILSLIHI